METRSRAGSAHYPRSLPHSPRFHFHHVVDLGALTWRFAYEIARASSPLTIWLAVAIGLFWLIRSAMQWLHYSANHWRGDALRTVIHWALFLGYGAMATVYLAAAFLRNT
jgi:hypothetical protein